MGEVVNKISDLLSNVLPRNITPDNTNLPHVRNANSYNKIAHNEFRKDMITGTACVTIIILGIKYVIPTVVEHLGILIDKLRNTKGVEIIEVDYIEEKED